MIYNRNILQLESCRLKDKCQHTFTNVSNVLRGPKWSTGFLTHLCNHARNVNPKSVKCFFLLELFLRGRASTLTITPNQAVPLIKRKQKQHLLRPIQKSQILTQPQTERSFDSAGAGLRNGTTLIVRVRESHRRSSPQAASSNRAGSSVLPSLINVSTDCFAT